MSVLEELLEKYADDPLLNEAIAKFEKISDDERSTTHEVTNAFNDVLDILKSFQLEEQGK